jgi:hypothetical protein
VGHVHYSHGTDCSTGAGTVSSFKKQESESVSWTAPL